MLLIDSAIARTGVFARAHYLVSVSRARARGPAASGFDPGAPASSYGVASARADRNRWPRGACGGCVLWHFRLPRPCSLSLGVRAPRRRAANGGHRGWPTTRLAAAFFFGLGDRAVAELFANRRPRGSWAEGWPSAGLGSEFWNWPSAERSLNLLGKRPAPTILSPFLVRAREAPRPAVSIRGRRHQAMG